MTEGMNEGMKTQFRHHYYSRVSASDSASRGESQDGLYQEKARF